MNFRTTGIKAGNEGSGAGMWRWYTLERGHG